MIELNCKTTIMILKKVEEKNIYSKFSDNL